MLLITPRWFWIPFNMTLLVWLIRLRVLLAVALLEKKYDKGMSLFSGLLFSLPDYWTQPGKRPSVLYIAHSSMWLCKWLSVNFCLLEMYIYIVKSFPFNLSIGYLLLIYKLLFTALVLCASVSANQLNSKCYHYTNAILIKLSI